MNEPIPTPHGGGTPVLSYAPLVLPVAGRTVDLAMRISAPATGGDLPIILLSHGHGPSSYVSSLYGYGPLADFYAAHGFAVIQPTHLDSATLGLRDADHPEAPLYWRSRAEDMISVLDHIDDIEAAVPQLAGRLDRTKVAVVGHSMGGHTASVLLGARVSDPLDGSPIDLVDGRIRAGVVLAGPGRGDALAPKAAEDHPVLRTTDFSEMRTPTLVVRGDADDLTHLTAAGPGWLEDPFRLAPAPKSQLILFGGEHGLGGISAYDAAETTDEDPARVAVVQRLTWAYLRSALDPEDPAWQDAVDDLVAEEAPLGRVESKEEDFRSAVRATGAALVVPEELERPSLGDGQQSSRDSTLRAFDATDFLGSSASRPRWGRSHLRSSSSSSAQAPRTFIELLSTIQSSWVATLCFMMSTARARCSSLMGPRVRSNSKANVHWVDAWSIAATSSCRRSMRSIVHSGWAVVTRFIALETRSRTTSSALK